MYSDISFISANEKIPRLYGGRWTLLCVARSLKKPKLFAIVCVSLTALTCTTFTMARNVDVFSVVNPQVLAYL
jgi:hypothetical protein